MNQTAQEWEQRFREEYRSTTGRPYRRIRLPESLGVEPQGAGIRLKLPAKSVVMNMQTDDAAFEAWALAFHLWLGVGNVVFDWETPDDLHDPHYQRFLYRVDRFQSLFPWFSITDRARVSACRVFTESVLSLNVPAAKTAEYKPAKTTREYQLEWALLNSQEFKDRFGLEVVDRQLPVGLFAGAVEKRNRIFTGGTSAIDLIGIGGDASLHIFELKAKDNTKVGLVSELLFYTAFLRDVTRKDSRIHFANERKQSRFRIRLSENVQQCARIHAVMLVEKLHPLLEHARLLETLNAGADERWNLDSGAKPVSFSLSIVENGDRLIEELRATVEAVV